MALIPNKHAFGDFSGGQIDVSPNLVPRNALELVQNWEVDEEIGTLVSRLGTAQIDSQLVDNKTILGLFQHVDQADTTKNKLFAVINDATDTNSDIWDLDGTPAISNADFTASKKCYFLNYNGDTLILNGTDAPEAYNSTSWITTGGVFDLADMPTGYKYPAEFLDRVYLWGRTAAPYTLQYSTVLTSGVIAWGTGDAGSVEIEPEDNGGEATGIGKVPGYILLFKRRSLHRFNFNSAFPESLVQIGAYSQESIINAGGLCAFYSDSNENAKGFYITDGGRPVPISHDTNRPIKKWVNAISSSATVAGWGTERYFAWSVGDITVDNETYSNVVLKYNRQLNQWTLRTYPTQFSVFASYVTGGVNSTLGGDDDGNVIHIDKASTYTDAPSTTAIPLKLRTHPMTWGYNQMKTIHDLIIARGRNLPNPTITAICDRDKRVSLHSPSWWRKILSAFKLTEEVKGTTIAIELAAESTGARVYLEEIEIPGLHVDETF